jgi:hypothetical protein
MEDYPEGIRYASSTEESLGSSLLDSCAICADRNRPVYRLVTLGSVSSAISLKRCILTGRLQAVGAGWIGFVYANQRDMKLFVTMLAKK